jgi:polyisoprenoid-binding protein YceI
MKLFLVLLVVASALQASALADPVTTDPARVPAGTYVLDPRHAGLTVMIPHLGGFSRYMMRFNALEGEFTYDPAAWQTTQVSIHVDAASIDTGLAGFNRQVAGFIGAASHPKIGFVGQSLSEVDGAKGKLAGELTLNGVTRPVTLDITFNGVGPGLLGAGTRLGFSGTGRIKRSDYGVTAVKAYAGDDVDLMFEIEFTKK